MQILSVFGVHETVAAVVQLPRKRLPFQPTAFCWAFTSCLRLPLALLVEAISNGVPAFQSEGEMANRGAFDYVLTVAVSVVAGVAAITSAVLGLSRYAVSYRRRQGQCHGEG